MTLGDQFASSLSNLALSVVVARSVGTEDYGAFALAYAAYALVLGVARAMGTEPLLIGHSGHDPDAATGHGAGAVGSSLVVGLAAGFVVALAGWVARGDARPALVAMGVCLPVLLVQDALRHVGFVSRRPQIAVVSDVLWLAAFLAGALALGGSAPVGGYVLLWGAGALAGAAVAVVLTRAWPSVTLGARWLRDHAKTGRRLTAEYVLVQGGPQAVLVVTTISTTLDDAAALRGASTLMGPAVVVAAGISVAVLPEGVRIRAQLGRLRRLVAATTASLFVLALVWGAVVSVLPESVGEQILGETWDAAREVTPPLAVAMAGTMAWSGLMVGMRALDAVRESLRATIPAAALLIVGGSIGGIVGGAHGAVVGMIAPALVGVALYAHRFRRVSAASPVA
jgi:O-antigen/teichoic acid export membrane protein